MVGRILRLFVRNLNGIENAPAAGGPVPRDPPDFAGFRALSEQFQRLQGRGLAVLTVRDRVDDLADAVPVPWLDARDLVEIKEAGFDVRRFYIDDRDLSSKTTLNLFSELLRLQKIGEVEGQPVLTLPLGP